MGEERGGGDIEQKGSRHVDGMIDERECAWNVESQKLTRLLLTIQAGGGGAGENRPIQFSRRALAAWTLLLLKSTNSLPVAVKIIT